MIAVVASLGVFVWLYGMQEDIDQGDTSNVQFMRWMFAYSQFNQDLSGWCFESISTKPNNFDTGATSWGGGDATRPQWGEECS